MTVPNWQLENIIICFVTAAAAVYLAVYAWQRQQVLGARSFTAMVVAVGWVSFWYGFEAAAGDDLAAYISFSKLEYIGLTFIPLTWLGLALSTSGRAGITTARWTLALAAIPLLTIVLAWTNEWHGLIWAEAHFEYTAFPPIFSATYGLAFWVYVVYSYLVFFTGSAILFQMALRSWSLYRAQSALVLFGTSIPWIGNLFEIFDITPIPGLYLHAVFLGISMVSMAFALFRLRLLDIMPMAQDVILQSIPNGVIVVDQQDRVVALNRALYRYLDEGQKAPIGQPLDKVFSRFASDIYELRGVTDGTVNREVDGQTIEIAITPVFDQRKRLRGRLLILSDITARARAEQARREQEALADTLREISNTLNSTLDLDKVLSLIASSVGQVVRHERADILMLAEDGYTARVLHHAPATAESEAALKGITFDYRSHQPLLEAARQPLIVPDTTLYPGWQDTDPLMRVCSFASAPIHVDGALVGFINLNSQTCGALTDGIADRLQIFADQAAVAIKNARLYEQVSRQAGELARRVETLTIAEWVYKEIGLSLKMSYLVEITLDAAMRMTLADGGYLALLADGTLQVSQYYGRYDEPKLAAILEAQAGIVGQAILTKTNVMTDKAEAIVSALEGIRAQIALPLYMSDGRTQTLAGMIVVETARPERFTEDRFQLLGLLADRVASAFENARLLEAVQAQFAELEQLYQRVSNLEQIKSDMIRIAAHDLKNPLSVMFGYVQLMMQATQEATLSSHRPFIEAMNRATRRMQQIIEDILSLERIEQMATQKHTPFDLSALVQEAAGEHLEQASKKRQQFTMLVEESACIVRGDTAQIREAVSNFISNAIKYTPEGGQIDVLLRQTKDRVRFEVRDTGYGIPEAQQKRLFEPFYRVRTQETQAIEGTGLGLHLVKNIIERHGGTMIFHSVYQQGSTFGFELPPYSDQPPSEDTSTQPPTSARAG